MGDFVKCFGEVGDNFLFFSLSMIIAPKQINFSGKKTWELN